MTSTQSRTPLWRICIWALYWLAIFIATHLPPTTRAMRLASGVPDWLLHGTAYAGLAAIAVWAPASRPTMRRQAIWFTILLAYGAMDEITQPLVGRSCELSDWFADAVGALTGLVAMSAWRRRRETSAHA